MTTYRPSRGSLVLYKSRQALVKEISDKIDILIEGGKSKRVRERDIVVLHPGPITNLPDLTESEGDLIETWELLEEGETHIEELAELLFGEFTPSTAWNTWRLVADGPYFEGTPEKIKARGAKEVEADRKTREAQAAEENAWIGFLARIEQKRVNDEDRKRLTEVERLALGETQQSRILQALDKQQNPENAHRMLLATGYWQQQFNPYPRRQGLTVSDPDFPVAELPREDRQDLTGLPAFAIDDEGSEDPDDAISLDGERIWVHVADVAAIVTPDSALDLDARARAANLYLPERTVHMLPPGITHTLGLGLQETSPALSFGFRLNERAEPVDLQIKTTLIRVSRHTYAGIGQRLDEPPFSALAAMAGRYRQRRLAAEASSIDLPEVSVRVKGEDVVIRPLDRIASREMVTDIMLMAGEAVAGYALEQDIPIPFATQPPPEQSMELVGMASNYAMRRQMKPSRVKTLEGPHSGLGLERYTRVTSPLRRYLDLVTHQQLRAHLSTEKPMPVQTISERIGATEAVTGAVRRAERLSNTHWKMIFLQQRPKWRGMGVVVELNERRATILLPELALEVRVHLQKQLPLDAELELALREVDLPDLKAWFRPL